MEMPGEARDTETRRQMLPVVEAASKSVEATTFVAALGWRVLPSAWRRKNTHPC
jgi:hypothetical protein